MPLENIVVKNMDHLGLVAGMVDELKIAESVDSCVPSNDPRKRLSFGELVKAMMLNGLGYVNKRLYLTPSFFKDKPLERLFGRPVQSEWINDDALGRTLDALYAYGVSELYEKIADEALKRLGLSPTIVHLDSTSFHVDGAYANQSGDSEDEPVAVHITRGYSRDHHPELNQVVLNLIVEHEAGIPLWMKAADGNQVDTQAFARIVKEHISSLRTTGESRTEVIADAALFTAKGMEHIRQNDMLFISRIPARLKEAKAFLKEYEAEDFVRLDDDYEAIEKEITYEGIRQHWTLYRSRPATQRENKTVEKKLTDIGIKEMKRLRKLMKTPFFCEADAMAALEEVGRKLTTIEMLQTTLEAVPKFKTRGRPSPDAVPDHYEYFWRIVMASPVETLRTRRHEKSGLFILATNDMERSAEALLQAYKSQQRVERGFRFLKSPEFLSDALFLKNPERIEAMLMIMTLCLLVYAALEYRIRKELEVQNKTFPNQLGKPVQNPTTRWIFENFFAIHTLRLDGQETVVGLDHRHRLILALLGKFYMKLYGMALNGV